MISFFRLSEYENEKIIVIAIFGQSAIDSCGYKTSPLELMLKKNVFRRSLLQYPKILKDSLVSFKFEVTG